MLSVIKIHKNALKHVERHQNSGAASILHQRQAVPADAGVDPVPGWAPLTNPGRSVEQAAAVAKRGTVGDGAAPTPAAVARTRAGVPAGL